MKIYRMIIAFILAIALACACAGAQEETGEIIDSKISDSGVIRVYLKSMAEETGLTVKFAGEYVVEASSAIRFERGAQAVIYNDAGNLLLSVGGMTLSMGQEMTLTRCRAEEGAENGLYILESEKHALYEGDITIACAGENLKCILEIDMEDYLKGVVAYEMSDSFPLEALKAQAVAARTYAMSRKSARVGAEYDVTDTTSDQVFKGYIPDYKNVIRAVDETSGIVGTYNGYYATCYYTASNGGQVATPGQIWGGDGDYGYIQQKNDPYDLENSRSLVNGFSVPASYDPDNLFWQMLDEKLDRSGHEDVRIDSIVSMETASPAFEGSLMNEELTVACLISTRDMGLVETSYEGDILLGWAMGLVRMPDEKWYEWGLMDWKQAEEAEIFTFGTYDEIKDGLDIGLNSRDYEILSAASDGENFTIEMRRFGHGVGMSQRGAQVMAGNHDFSYDGILKFYYPGMTLERIDWTSTALPEMDALPDGMIRMRLNIPPRVVDLGELAEGEYFARVSLESAKSRLNVRAEPSTQASIAVRLDHGFRVVVCEDAGDGWVRIRGGSFTGYVKAEYLTAE